MIKKPFLFIGLASLIILVIVVIFLVLISKKPRPVQAPSPPEVGVAVPPSSDLNPELAFIKDSVLFPTFVNQTTLRYLAGQSPEFIDFDLSSGVIIKRYPAELAPVLTIEYNRSKDQALVETEVSSFDEARFLIYNFSTTKIGRLPAETQAVAWTPAGLLIAAERKGNQTSIVITRQNQKEELLTTELSINKIYPLTIEGQALIYSIDDESTLGQLHLLKDKTMTPYLDQLTALPSISPQLDTIWVGRGGKSELFHIENRKVVVSLSSVESSMAASDLDGQFSYLVVERLVRLEPLLEPLRQDQVLQVNNQTGEFKSLLPTKSNFKRDIQSIFVTNDAIYMVSDFTLYKIKR